MTTLMHDMRLSGMPRGGRQSGLRCPPQRLAHRFRDPGAPGLSTDRAWPWRVAVMSLSCAATVALSSVIALHLDRSGFGAVEAVIVGLVGFTFFTIAFSVFSVSAGLVALLRGTTRCDDAKPVPPLRTAILVPVYEEDPALVFGNAAAMLEDLAHQNLDRAGGRHEYALFVLSDTRTETNASRESLAAAILASHAPASIPVHYRRRSENTDRKVGNIRDWLETHGADWPAMLVLDADSLMTGEAIVALTDALAGDPAAGLVQTVPMVHAAHSVFGRLQQFSHRAYGALAALGLQTWAGNAGNYWGHNAIIRTRAFARSATVPHLPGRGATGGLILSHDFVEAALLRRAGWAIRFRPDIEGSYEETPQTLVDHVLRDRRWSRGNLQHLRLLGTAGLHPVSRVHMLLGALGYLTSPAWFALLVIWALRGQGEGSVVVYLDRAYELPPAPPGGLALMLIVVCLLLAPKILGLLSFRRAAGGADRFGGRTTLVLSVATEIALAVCYAPILMVQQTIAVARTALGLPQGWAPQARGASTFPLVVLAKFHALEIVTGLALLVGIIVHVVSPWLLPVALPLLFAVPLSALSGRTTALMPTPEDLAQPAVARRADVLRGTIAGGLETPPPPPATRIAAE